MSLSRRCSRLPRRPRRPQCAPAGWPRRSSGRSRLTLGRARQSPGSLPIAPLPERRSTGRAAGRGDLRIRVDPARHTRRPAAPGQSAAACGTHRNAPADVPARQPPSQRCGGCCRVRVPRRRPVRATPSAPASGHTAFAATWRCVVRGRCGAAVPRCAWSPCRGRASGRRSARAASRSTARSCRAPSSGARRCRFPDGARRFAVRPTVRRLQAAPWRERRIRAAR